MGGFRPFWASLGKTDRCINGSISTNLSFVHALGGEAYRSGAPRSLLPSILFIPVAFKQLTNKFHIYPALATSFLNSY